MTANSLIATIYTLNFAAFSSSNPLAHIEKENAMNLSITMNKLTPIPIRTKFKSTFTGNLKPIDAKNMNAKISRTHLALSRKYSAAFVSENTIPPIKEPNTGESPMELATQENIRATAMPESKISSSPYLARKFSNLLNITKPTPMRPMKSNTSLDISKNTELKVNVWRVIIEVKTPMPIMAIRSSNVAMPKTVLTSLSPNSLRILLSSKSLNAILVLVFTANNIKKRV